MLGQQLMIKVITIYVHDELEERGEILEDPVELIMNNEETIIMDAAK